MTKNKLHIPISITSMQKHACFNKFLKEFQIILLIIYSYLMHAFSQRNFKHKILHGKNIYIQLLEFYFLNAISSTLIHQLIA